MSLTGQLLLAMPQMLDERFARSVVYVCAHSGEAGAMGLVINKPLGSLTMGELFAQLDISPSGADGSSTAPSQLEIAVSYAVTRAKAFRIKRHRVAAEIAPPLPSSS